MIVVLAHTLVIAALVWASGAVAMLTSLLVIKHDDRPTHDTGWP